MQRETASAVLAKYKAIMASQAKHLVTLGMDSDIARRKVQAMADQDFIAKLTQQASSARQSRRDYEADRLEVQLRKPRDITARGANGRARARCTNSATGHDTSPRPFHGRAHYAVMQARADCAANYTKTYDDNGVWLGTTAAITHDDGSLTGFGALSELANIAPSRPTNPESAALTNIARQQAKTMRIAELDTIASKARNLARHEGRKAKRGKRGGNRGRKR